MDEARFNAENKLPAPKILKWSLISMLLNLAGTPLQCHYTNVTIDLENVNCLLVFMIFAHATIMKE